MRPARCPSACTGRVAEETGAQLKIGPRWADLRAVSDASTQVGWFEGPTPGAGEEITDTVPSRPVGLVTRLRGMQAATRITLGVAVISGLVLLSGVNDFFGPSLWAGSTAGTGALDAIRDVIGFGLILLGFGIFMRRAGARRTYLVLAALGYFAILDDAGSVAPIVTVIALALQTIPVVFLTRLSVSATFK